MRIGNLPENLTFLITITKPTTPAVLSAAPWPLGELAEGEPETARISESSGRGRRKSSPRGKAKKSRKRRGRT